MAVAFLFQKIVNPNVVATLQVCKCECAFVAEANIATFALQPITEIRHMPKSRD